MSPNTVPPGRTTKVRPVGEVRSTSAPDSLSKTMPHLDMCVLAGAQAVL